MTQGGGVDKASGRTFTCGACSGSAARCRCRPGERDCAASGGLHPASSRFEAAPASPGFGRGLANWERGSFQVDYYPKGRCRLWTGDPHLGAVPSERVAETRGHG